MGALSEHSRRARERFPGDELCVVFDIDGTILDVRHLVVHVFLGYDRSNGTQQFRGLVVDDITHHEDDVQALMAALDVPPGLRESVAAYYVAHLWDDEAVLAASRPFEGVLGGSGGSSCSRAPTSS